MIILKSDHEIGIMRKAGKIVGEAHEHVKQYIRPGVTTGELNKIIEDYILRKGAIPSFKGYNGFPASACISVNEEVVHGIPGDKVLKDGDIVSIDIGAIIEGYHGDAARTHPVGNVSEEALRLIQVTEQSFFKGLKYAVVNQRLSDISNAVQSYVESNGFSVVRALVGHGIGQQMHEEPQVPNFGRPGKGPRLREGMTLAIEPMVNMGTYAVRQLSDGWTIVTADGKLSSHFEHTVAITKTGPIILTLP